MRIWSFVRPHRRITPYCFRPVPVESPVMDPSLKTAHQLSGGGRAAGIDA